MWNAHKRFKNCPEEIVHFVVCTNVIYLLLGWVEMTWIEWFAIWGFIFGFLPNCNEKEREKKINYNLKIECQGINNCSFFLCAKHSITIFGYFQKFLLSYQEKQKKKNKLKKPFAILFSFKI